jgi:hypothetical protein
MVHKFTDAKHATFSAGKLHDSSSPASWYDNDTWSYEITNINLFLTGALS